MTLPDLEDLWVKTYAVLCQCIQTNSLLRATRDAGNKTATDTQISVVCNVPDNVLRFDVSLTRSNRR
jgi:hypothetical protein